MYNTFDSHGFHLDTSSRKFICPRCGRRTFVVYLDRDNRMLSPDVGRCDRQDKCAWHYPPRAYFADRDSPAYYNNKKNNIYIYNDLSRRGRTQRVTEYTEPDYIEPRIFVRTMMRREDNRLFDFLHRVFDPLTGPQRVSDMFTRSGVGTSTLFGGSPVYWQLDRSSHIRTGKIMGYDAETGKRLKAGGARMQWVHAMMRREQGDFRMQQCYFGTHLAAGNEKVIWLFESEKAALIVNLTLDWCGATDIFVALSCGGCGGLNPEPYRLKDPYDALSILRGRKVTLFPDEGKYGEWERKGRMLRGLCKEVYISDLMERKPEFEPECPIEPGDALDDILLRLIANGVNVETVASLLLTSYGV